MLLMWVDEGAILVAKTFPFGCLKCTLKSMHFQGPREAAGLPQWKEGGPLLYHHHTTRCCVKGILHLLF